MRRMRVRVNGQSYEVEVGDVYHSPVEVLVDGEAYLVELDPETGTAPRMRRTVLKQDRKEDQPGLRGITQGDEKTIRCPLPGRVVSMSVVKGQQLAAGDEICVLESMKMEQSVRIATAGTAKSIKVKSNQTVIAGAPLIELQ